MKRIIAAILLLLLAGAGAFIYFAPDTAIGLINKVSGAAAAAEVAEEKPKELQVYTIEKVLLTLPEMGESTILHHAQLDVVIASFDPKAVVQLTKLDPLLRNVVVEIFADKTFEHLKNMKNIDALQKEVQGAFVGTFAKYQINLELLDVKFSKMVMQ